MCIRDRGEGEDADEVGPTDTNSLAKRMRRELQEELIYRTTNGVGQWGQMDIHNPPLSEASKGFLSSWETPAGPSRPIVTLFPCSKGT